MAYVYDLSTTESEAGLPRNEGQPRLHNETLASKAKQNKNKKQKYIF